MLPQAAGTNAREILLCYLLIKGTAAKEKPNLWIKPATHTNAYLTVPRTLGRHKLGKFVWHILGPVIP
jgi:hypothetical protein